MSTAPPQEPPRTQEIKLTDRHRWRAYWVCVGVAALTILDLSKVNVALPSIEAAFGAGSTELQLVVSGYVLAFGLALVPMGRLGDQRSRRVLFIVGLSLFTVTSLACALAQDVTFLLVARLIQGVAAGIQMPQVLGLIQQLFRGAERGKAFGLFGASIGIATAFGPTLGGLAIAIGGPTDGWRGIFWMNVPLALIAIAAAIWLLPATRTKSRRKLSLDPIGILLFGLAVISLLWPFLFTTGSPSDDPNRWWLLVPSVLFIGAFIVWERSYEARGHQPLVPLGLFGVSSYRNGTVLATAYFAALPALFLLTTLFLQSGVGLEPVFAGMVTIGFALVSALTSWFGGLWVNRIGRPLVVWGLAIMLVEHGRASCWRPCSSRAGAIIWVMAGIMVFAGAGGGLVVSPNQTLALADIPPKRGGLAGSVGQLGQRIGTSIGTAIALAFFYATVYSESGTAPTIVVYHDAYALGMVAVGVALALAFVISLVDLTARAKKAK